MNLHVWGCRGSIPVSGPEYARYGGDTTCIELVTRDGQTVILDAGTGLRRMGNKVLQDGRKEFHMLLSHAHWDHIMGFPFFKPLFRKDTVISLHGWTAAQKSLKTALQYLMHPPHFPVQLQQVGAKLNFDKVCSKTMSFAGLKVKTIPLSHPNGGFGYLIQEGGKSVAFLPDNELTLKHPDGKSFNDYAKFVQDADVLIHDAEYTEKEYNAFSKGFGHSIFLDTVKLGLQAKVKKLVLWHINQDRGDQAVDALLAEARQAVVNAGSSMAVEMAYAGLEIGL